MWENVKNWIGLIVEMGLVLIPLGLLLQVLFGKGFVLFIKADILNNLFAVIREFGDNGLIGLIALAVVVWVFSKILKKGSVAPSQPSGESYTSHT